jgi:hypothetical protein
MSIEKAMVMVLCSKFINKKYGIVVEEQSSFMKLDGSILKFRVFVIVVKCFLLFHTESVRKVMRLGQLKKIYLT